MNIKISSFFQKIIENFENKKFSEKESNQYSGIVYTPSKITNFIVENIIKIFLDDFFNKNGLSPFAEVSRLDFCKLREFLEKNPTINEALLKKIKKLKILDPACGSGRFLLSAGEILLKVYKILDSGLEDFDIKEIIVKNMLYGVEIENTAYIITKIRLTSWLFSSKKKLQTFNLDKLKNVKLEELEQILDEINIQFNLFNLDFLLEFELSNFDIIIGNPPYVENKKIIDIDFKKKIKERFKSAYKLYDLSVIFIEKSLEILKENKGFLSFLTTNKFLSADYGIKIRNLLVKNTELKELINISSLKVFENISAYPIIITFKKSRVNLNNIVSIKQINKLDDLFGANNIISKKFSQDLINMLPANVIPISGNLNLVQQLYTHFKPMSEVFKDLKIIYRPFGFTNWAKNFDNISKLKKSDRDLLLIGTGNVGKYHIKFEKRIRIAKRNLLISYFNYNSKFEKIWKDLSSEKLIFREIAKDLTFIYDSGEITNITGLYFLRIQSFDTNRYFCLLTILNSRLMNSVFKTLFGTLHMSGGYLRFNGSFIKRLPMPNYFPISLSQLGKILQFLSQVQYDLTFNSNLEFKSISLNKLEELLNFFNKLANSLVFLLYWMELDDKSIHNYSLLDKLLKSENYFPDVQFKGFLPRLSSAEIYELDARFLEINSIFCKLCDQDKLVKQMEHILLS